MSKKNLFLAIQNGFWLIDEGYAMGIGATIAKVMAGEIVFSTDDNAPPRCYSVSRSGEVFTADKKASNPFSNAADGSIAVISIDGPIMKHDNCGDPGTQTYETWLKQADANPNIQGIVLKTDTPGGSVDGTESLSNVVKSLSKPAVTFVDGLMASAGYWIGSRANYIMASGKSSRIGSIGTMISFADMQPVWEKQGVKFHEVYADDSSDKNRAYIDARAGNYKKIKEEMLNPLNDIFKAAVQEARAGKIDLKKENVLTGKVYVASHALENGLIDGIGTLDDAISKAFELSNSQTQNNPKTNTMKKLSMFASMWSFLSLKGFSNAAEQEHLTDEQKEVIDAELKTLGDVKTAHQKTTDDLKAANDKIVSLEETISSQSTKITDLEAKVKEYGSKNAGATTTVKEGNDKNEAEGKADSVWELPHNKAALNNPLFS